ncbi:MAG: hypothetical protein ACREBR_03720 [bacterium]
MSSHEKARRQSGEDDDAHQHRDKNYQTHSLAQLAYSAQQEG